LLLTCCLSFDQYVVHQGGSNIAVSGAIRCSKRNSKKGMDGLGQVVGLLKCLNASCLGPVGPAQVGNGSPAMKSFAEVVTSGVRPDKLAHGAAL
jgi:hypothetical protein